MKNIPAEILDLVLVDPMSPTGARWAVNHGRHSIGAVLGYETGNKLYWRQKINNKEFAVHNLIWIKENGSIPKNKTVDHIDNNGQNNKIDNLRLANSLQQLQNRRGWSKSKLKGTSKIKNQTLFAAYCMYPKYGRVHLGYYKFAEHAAIAHDIAAVILFNNDEYYKLNYPNAFWLKQSTCISDKVLEKLNVFFETKV